MSLAQPTATTACRSPFSPHPEAEVQMAAHLMGPVSYISGVVLKSPERRPVETYRSSKRGACVGFQDIGRTITGSMWRRIPSGIARITCAEIFSNPGSYERVRMRKCRSDPISCRETGGCETQD